MITSITVQNRFNMNFYAQMDIDSGMPFIDKPWHLISIHGDSPKYLTDKNISTLKKLGMLDYLSLEFWDITDDKGILEQLTLHNYDYILFSKEHATNIIGFLDKRRFEIGEHILVVHCDAGISRSGAVASVAAEMYNIPQQEFLKQNPYLRPNWYIRRVLRETAGLTGINTLLTAAECK